MKTLFSSESVRRGHPDKMCDAISDAVLDAILAKDPMARVACETMATTGMVFVTGEITTECYVDIAQIARDTIRDIGYTRAKHGFDADSCAVVTAINKQSPDIAQGVDHARDEDITGDAAAAVGAGDQGMMFGYATRDTAEFMPLPIVLAHGLCRKLDELMLGGIVDYLRPDGKAQVTLEYENGRPTRVHTVVVSTQHTPDADNATMREDIIQRVIRPTIPAEFLDENTRFFINPTGRFVIGGPTGDVGLTGRKIIVDTYGGAAAHGGGAFSGKDPTKVDRSGAYMARYLAKNIVAADLADMCEVQLAYAIGVAQPVSVHIDTKNTAKIDEAKILAAIIEHVDMRPGKIIERFGLRRPIYAKTAAYGHFGRPDADFPWEKTDLAEILKGVK